MLECMDITVKLQENQKDELASISHTQLIFFWIPFKNVSLKLFEKYE